MNEVLAASNKYKQFQIVILGIFSAIPLMFIFSTLQAWMHDYKVSLEIITTFAAARIPYSLKPLFAPIMDHITLPFFPRHWRRKSWIIVMAAIIASLFFFISISDPSTELGILYLLTIAMGFASASLDTNIDAFRVDSLPQELQTLGAANAVFGYRIGMLLSGGFAMYSADIFGWKIVLMFLSSLYCVFIIYALTLKEPERQSQAVTELSKNHSWVRKLIGIFITPFWDFFAKNDKSFILILAIILFKLGEAFFGVVTMPFYKELGFTNKEIGSIVKTYGLVATIVGSYIGAYLMLKFGNYKGLIINATLQSVTNFSFVWLHHQGHDLMSLGIAITIENVASGMGSAALVGFLSSLCNKKYSASQYALFSSAASLTNNTVVMYGGTLVKMIGWDYYFAMTVFLGLPGIILLSYLGKAQKNKELENAQ